MEVDEYASPASGSGRGGDFGLSAWDFKSYKKNRPTLNRPTFDKEGHAAKLIFRILNSIDAYAINKEEGDFPGEQVRHPNFAKGEDDLDDPSSKNAKGIKTAHSTESIKGVPGYKGYKSTVWSHMQNIWAGRKGKYRHWFPEDFPEEHGPPKRAEHFQRKYNNVRLLTSAGRAACLLLSIGRATDP